MGEPGKVILFGDDSIPPEETHVGGAVVLRGPDWLIGFAAQARPVRVHPSRLGEVENELLDIGCDVRRADHFTYPEVG